MGAYLILSFSFLGLKTFKHFRNLNNYPIKQTNIPLSNILTLDDPDKKWCESANNLMAT